MSNPSVLPEIACAVAMLRKSAHVNRNLRLSRQNCSAAHRRWLIMAPIGSMVEAQAQAGTLGTDRDEVSVAIVVASIPAPISEGQWAELIEWHGDDEEIDEALAEVLPMLPMESQQLVARRLSRNMSREEMDLEAGLEAVRAVLKKLPAGQPRNRAVRTLQHVGEEYSSIVIEVEDDVSRPLFCLGRDYRTAKGQGAYAWEKPAAS